MSKIFFFYSTMCAYKSSYLINFYSYCKRNGFGAMLFTHKLDTRYGYSLVASRLGLKEYAFVVDDSVNIFLYILKYYRVFLNFSFVFVDEIQFLSKKHIEQLLQVTSRFGVVVIGFGLRSDFLGKPFKGSSYMMAVADKLISLNSFCFCGNGATFNMRFNQKGFKVQKGRKILIGDNNMYIPVCRYHFFISDKCK